MQIRINFPTYQVEAEIYDTPTGRALLNQLPLKSNVNTWGQEIYFEVSAYAELEADARSKVRVGDLAYWPNMPAFCIFFGSTPMSTNDEPVAASAVNVFGRLNKVELPALSGIANGVNVSVEQID
jgi:hypothetical protein